MTTAFSRRLWSLSTFYAALWLAAPKPLAQSPPWLGLQVSNGLARLTITGTAGAVYQLQYITNVTRTNAWAPLTNLTLTGNSQTWVDVSHPATGARLYRAVASGSPSSAGMVLIPAGSFTMGDALDDLSDAPLHTVYVSGFYMDQSLVTSNLWFSIMFWNGGNGYSYWYGGLGKASVHPVSLVDWYDVVKWCNARSQKEGLTPCYYADAGLTAVYKTGQSDEVYVNWAANGYRLPTEAEWEKAARGGLIGHRFPWGDTISESQANYYSTGTNNFEYDLSNTGFNPSFYDGVPPNTTPVGYFAANGYGLYDMAGNVLEWCWDWYSDTYYYSSPATDPRGPGSGVRRIQRGGDWLDQAIWARTAFRLNNTPSSADSKTGFRCVRGL